MTAHPLTTLPHATVQPLQSLPSMLAIRDIRRRIIASRPDLDDLRSVAALLSLDPLSCLRALRLAHAPMLQSQLSAGAGVPQLVRFLGSAAVLRILDVPVVDPERTRRLRRLWLHSIATAVAARRLALRFGGIEPELAWLRGLLHDLTHWLHYLGLHHNGSPSQLDGWDLARAWNLPIGGETLDPPSLPLDVGLSATLTDHPERILPMAEALAVLASFRHPDDDTAPRERSATLGASHREALIEAHEISDEVAGRLAAFGLDLGADDLPDGTPPGDEEQPLFAGRTRGDATELVLGLLACRGGGSYRQVESVACAAALRYLDFDRAFLLAIEPDQLATAWLRNCADRTIVRVPRQAIVPTRAEQLSLGEVLRRGEPRILVRSEPPEGICGRLAADRMLAVPVPSDRHPAVVLLLDRAPTGRPIELESDGTPARALAGCTAMLLENLELRLRRRRAEVDAMIDPLTRLYNRGVGISRLEEEISRARRQCRMLCVMMADLDEFKRLNDELGHLRGDEALRISASVLRRTCRREDTVCRYGGEEFLIVLPDTDPESAAVLAARLFTEVESSGQQAGLPLTVSIGLAALQEGDNLDSLVGRADHALYASKLSGRNRFCSAVE
ncbi:MAG: diguanylate cyclase [Planctomycetes bacterium]|nr:diguanylate cyclase [Planctomycetota bacterium]